MDVLTGMVENACRCPKPGSAAVRLAIFTVNRPKPLGNTAPFLL
jgi:hypothetical protein